MNNRLRTPKPPPLGATLSESGCHFALHSSTAKKVSLCLFQADGTEQRLPMKYRHGGLWYTHVEGVKENQQYGYRIEPSPGAVGNPHKLLLDPYAMALSGKVTWHESLRWQGDWALVDSAPQMPKSVVKSLSPLDTEAISLPPQDRIIYELHVKGFTQQHPEVPAEHRGKYLGLGHPSVIRYLQSLGVTSLQLMPCFSFMDEPRLVAQGLVNYWGYNPVHFFVPDWRYAVQDPVEEFRWMVQQLHMAGFEVILDVVYNHTGEGALDEGMICLKGIDACYYRQSSNPQQPGEQHTGIVMGQPDAGDSTVRESAAGHSELQASGRYLNYSGCGNSLQTEHPTVLQLVMDSLRHWVTHYGVDGFRFDLAASLMREGPDHIGGNTALLQALSQDPLLRDRVLIAEPWDLGPNGYQLGSFSAQWLEVNDHYRDDLRRFWRGDPAGVASLCTRLMGSRDIFDKQSRSQACSVNHITYHDGFTLQDLVSYRRRQNQANGEQGQDGHAHNLSCNHGVEGETTDSEILRKREQHQKNLLMSLLISRGTPHLLAGDEFGNSQQGNNNAYCQDNPTSWLNWQQLTSRHSLVSFVQQLIRFRQTLFTLNDLQMPDEAFHEVIDPDGADIHGLETLDINDHLCWLDQYGYPMQAPEWHNPEQRFIGLKVSRQSDGGADDWLLLFNGSTNRVVFSGDKFQMEKWRLVVSTAPADTKVVEDEDSRRQDSLTQVVAAAFSVSLWRGAENQESV